MKKKFIEKSYQFITKYQTCSDLKTKKIKYGLEGIYNVSTKLLVILILTIILGVWKEYLLLIIFYSFVKKYTYGIHAKSSKACWITTLSIYIFGCYFIKLANLPTIFIYIIWTFSFISFFLWAPADTPSRPLIHKEIRIKQKMKACCICLFYLFLLITLKQDYFYNVITYSLFIQTACINPIVYRLTKTPFENYKIYCKTHGLNY